MRRVRCKYCRKRIAACGMPAHVSFKHRDMVIAGFYLNPYMQAFNIIEHGVIRPFEQKQLPAPNPLTIYSTRPLGMMAAPIPEHRRPKGYTLGYGYARPFEALALQLRFNRYF